MTQYDPTGGTSLLTGATDPNGDTITVRKINGTNVDWATNPQTVTLTIGTAKVWQNGAVKYDDGGVVTNHPFTSQSKSAGSFTFTLWDGSLESPAYTATLGLTGLVPAAPIGMNAIPDGEWTSAYSQTITYSGLTGTITVSGLPTGMTGDAAAGSLALGGTPV